MKHFHGESVSSVAADETKAVTMVDSKGSDSPLRLIAFIAMWLDMFFLRVPKVT